MPAHNSQFQLGENGPLKPAVRQRLENVKDKLNLTLAQVGTRLDFSGPFISALLKDSNPARVRTKHVNRIMAAIHQMEVQAGVSSAPARSQSPQPSPPLQPSASSPALSDLIQAAHRLGFEVSFKPL